VQNLRRHAGPEAHRRAELKAFIPCANACFRTTLLIILQAWGGNIYGNLGSATMTNSLVPVTVSGTTNAAAIAAAEVHTCAVLNDGTVLCWGSNYQGELGNGTRTGSSTPVTVVGS
jgi:alpha-tubulin suppressor-like RCC1 family protein